MDRPDERVPAFLVILLFLVSLPASAQQPKGQTYSLKPTPQTVAWGYYDARKPPVLRVHSGDTVEIQTLLASASPAQLEAAGLPSDQVEPSLREVFQKVTDKGPGLAILTGPIFVEDAKPGDVLEVRIQTIRLAVPWAFNRFRPGFGLLPDDFPYTRSRIIRFDEKRMIAHFAGGIDIPLKPFFGSIGVAPPEVSGRLDSGPPWIHGGNMDNKALVAGTTLFFPVHAPGALLFVGDGHGGQGNGEVDVAAMETSLIGTFQLFVRKDMHLRWPRAETPTEYITMGFNEDLNEATKMAVREMIDFLVNEKGLSRDDAYMLTSVAADLSITQVVDGNKGVHASIAKGIFRVP
jgi:acetamidase/formamidase